MKLKINPEYLKLVPRPTKEDYNRIYDSIKNEGQKQPIEHNQHGMILDGHTRFEILTELGITPKTKQLSFKSVIEEKEYMITVNLARRHLTQLQRVKQAIILEKIEGEKAVLRMKSGHPVPILEQGRASEIAAKKAGISKGTLYHGKNLLKSNNKTLLDKVERGVLSVSFAARQIQREKLKTTKPIADPSGEKDLGYMDYSWEFGLKTSITPKYRTMTLEQGKKMKLGLKKKSALFFWTTMSNINQSEVLLGHWGYKIISEIIWVKVKDSDKLRGLQIVSVEDMDKLLATPNQGHYADGVHEKLYICTRGGIGTPVWKPKSVIFAPKSEHSKKPEIFGHIINKMYPHLTKREYFHRGQRPSYGTEEWDFWGDESKA